MENFTDALKIGTVIKSPVNSYRIEEVLGKGGFGITYKASTYVKFGNVDVKVYFCIKEHFISGTNERSSDTRTVTCSAPQRDRIADSKKDFIAEARRLQDVGSKVPNIVKVNEVFEDNNTAYYVMEYIDGCSLRKHIDSNGTLTPQVAINLLAPIFDALEALHNLRMTHLDVKPDNIMISYDDQGNTKLTLIDFGLSKHYDKDGSPTSTINILGCSDGYSPIEQYGGITTFSPWADVYSLAATIMYCITGKTPKKATEMRPGEVESSLKSIAPDAAAAIGKAMNNDRFSRTESIASLRKDLSSPVGSQPPVPHAAKFETNGTQVLNTGNANGGGAGLPPTVPPAAATGNYDNYGQKAKGGKKTVLIIVIASIVTLALAIGLYFFLSSGSKSSRSYDEDSRFVIDDEEVTKDDDDFDEMPNYYEEEEAAVDSVAVYEPSPEAVGWDENGNWYDEYGNWYDQYGNYLYSVEAPAEEVSVAE